MENDFVKLLLKESKHFGVDFAGNFFPPARWDYSRIKDLADSPLKTNNRNLCCTFTDLCI